MNLLPLLIAATIVPALAQAAPASRAALLSSIRATDVCKDCHEDHYSAQVMHYPASDGLCLLCHEVKPGHTETGDTTLVTKKYDPNQTCLVCHDIAPLGPVIHKPLTGGKYCASCHNPHGSAYPKFFTAAGDKMCAGCHVNHSAADPTVKSVHRVGTGDRNCLVCHGSHSAPQKHLLSEQPPALCTSCHDRVLTSSSGRKIRNIAKRLAARYEHVPAPDCTSCHNPHQSKFDRLLLDRYPGEDHALFEPGDASRPGTYALCFQCHELSMLARGSDQTGFRNDTPSWRGGVARFNLHRYHVLNETGTTGGKMGRACHVCHDPHGATQERILRPDLGNYGLSLEVSLNAEGGTCAKSCHGERTWKRMK